MIKNGPKHIKTYLVQHASMSSALVVAFAPLLAALVWCMGRRGTGAPESGTGSSNIYNLSCALMPVPDSGAPCS